MKYVEVVAEETSSATILAIAQKVHAQDFRLGPVGDDQMQQMRMLLSDDQLQSALDLLQNTLGAQSTAHIVVLAVEASLPKLEEEKQKKEDEAIAVREALYREVEKNTQLDWNFLVLVVLSTVVAALGLIRDNIAVVIGAMVIAPLLGPNLALSLGTALGDIHLVRKAARTLLVGIVLAVLLSAVIGLLSPGQLRSPELMLRTDVGWDSIVLALASGAAAALSLTSGLATILVGVMVAVALLPPAAALGILLGQGRISLAAGAGLLLAVNIVSVNLASKLVFFAKKIEPRTWLEKEKAMRAMWVYVLGWLVALAILAVAIYFRHSLPV